MKLLEQLVAVHSPSGSEHHMKQFLLEYCKEKSTSWKVQPRIFYGEELFGGIVMVFGKPRTAIFAHMDSVGYTCRYENQLVPIGSPDAPEGTWLVGEDGLGPIRCRLQIDEEGRLTHDFARSIERGTTLVYEPNFRLTEAFLQSPYMDNRLGVYNALRTAETLEDGIIAFSTYEEHGGGSIPVLLDFIQQQFPVKQALISDITWVTDGVSHHDGVAISLRDRNIPRKVFIDKVLALANQSNVPFQLEVEGAGSSDGREVQLSKYAMDWCFVGAPEDHVHSPDEKVSTKDIESMISMYRYLMGKL